MTYKGLSARVEFDGEDDIFVGRLPESMMWSAFTPIRWRR